MGDFTTMELEFVVMDREFPAQEPIGSADALSKAMEEIERLKATIADLQKPNWGQF